MMTRRNFCKIALAAPVFANYWSHIPRWLQDDQSTIREVETNLMWFRDGKLVPVNMDLQNRMQHYSVPGFSIAVIDKYRVAWAKGYGVFERHAQRQITPDSLFAAGSISKPVSAAAALALVEKHRLLLDEDVNKKLRSWKIPDNEFTNGEKVTLRRLLSHTAGLNEGGAPSIADGEQSFTLLQELDGLPPTNPEAPERHADPVRVEAVPGSRFLYSPGGYAALTVLMEDVEGKPFEGIMEDTIFRPLDLPNSTFEQPLEGRFLEHATTEHKDGMPLEGKRRYFPALAAGGLWSTPTDIAGFLIEIMLSWSGRSRKILSPSFAKEMLTCQFGRYNEKTGGQALGFWVQGDGDGFVCGHKGGTYGSSCQCVAFPRTGHGAVLMANDRPGGEKLVPETLFSIGTVYHWPWQLG